MRVRGYDEETQALSEDIISLKGEVVDLTKTASNNYQGISLFTDASQTEYKSTYTYLKEISGVIDELDAKSKQKLLEDLFGKTRASVGAAIIQNFSAAEDAMDTMANSAGSAEKELSIATESIEFKLNALAQTWVGVAQNLFQRDDIKLVIDALTGLSEIIETITDKIGLLGTVAIGGGLAAFIKNLDRARNRALSYIKVGPLHIVGLVIMATIRDVLMAVLCWHRPAFTEMPVFKNIVNRASAGTP